MSARNFATTLSVLLLMATFACQTTSDQVIQPDLRFEIPPRWQESLSAAEDTAAERPTVVSPNWWQSFQDPQLERYIGELLSANLDLAAERQKVARMRILAARAGADLAPHLNLQFQSSRQRQLFVGLPIPGSDGILSDTYDQHALALNFSWELDLWGRLADQSRGAGLDLEAQEATFSAVALSLIAELCRSWFRLATAHELVKLQGELENSHRRDFVVAEARFQSGDWGADALAESRAAWARSKAQAQEARLLMNLEAKAFALQLGRYPETKPQAQEMTLWDKLPRPPEVGIPSNLLRRRWDLVAAERHCLATGWRLKASKKQLLPAISLTGAAGTTSQELSDLTKHQFGVWSLAGAILQPLFSGGRIDANIQLANNAQKQALLSFSNLTLRAFLEVESCLAKERALRGQWQHDRVALVASRKQLKIARDRHKLGDLAPSGLEAAIRRETTATAQLLSRQRQFLLNRIDLHLALGGGF